jgi:hypothetical protein
MILGLAARQREAKMVFVQRFFAEAILIACAKEIDDGNVMAHYAERILGRLASEASTPRQYSDLIFPQPGECLRAGPSAAVRHEYHRVHHRRLRLEYR